MKTNYELQIHFTEGSFFESQELFLYLITSTVLDAIILWGVKYRQMYRRNIKEQSQAGWHYSITNAFGLSRHIIQFSLVQILIHSSLCSVFLHFKDIQNLRIKSKQQKLVFPNAFIFDFLKSPFITVLFSYPPFSCLQ